jgi:hypothetical protein
VWGWCGEDAVVEVADGVVHVVVDEVGVDCD